MSVGDDGRSVRYVLIAGRSGAYGHCVTVDLDACARSGPSS